MIHINTEKICSGTVEVVTKKELQDIFDSGKRRAYIGFEPSGKGHIGWLILAKKIRDLNESGFSVDILLSYTHSKINDKLGGDEKRIEEAGNYLVETFNRLGSKFNVVKASDFISTEGYVKTLLKVCKSVNPARIRRAMDIMGRSGEDESLDFAKMLYPAMQVADIFHNDWQVCLGGLDQRHAHMLARDVAVQNNWKPPVAIHTPLIPSLNGAGRMNPVDKMGKSNIAGSIFLSDSRQEIEQKIKSALFPPKDTDNAIVSIAVNILFGVNNYKMKIERPIKYGGDIEISAVDEFLGLVRSGKLHPTDVKLTVSKDLHSVIINAT